MPEEEKKTVDIDTSGPGADIDIEQPKRRSCCRSRTVERTRKYENEKEGTDKTL